MICVSSQHIIRRQRKVIPIEITRGRKILKLEENNAYSQEKYLYFKSTFFYANTTIYFTNPDEVQKKQVVDYFKKLSFLFRDHQIKSLEKKSFF